MPDTLDGFTAEPLTLIEQPQLPTDKVYLNIYHVDRCYGGPEEGGWYYDHFTPELCIPTERQHAEALRTQYAAQQGYEAQKDRWGREVPLSSVLSTGGWAFQIEDSPPRETVPPHYE